MLYDENLKDSTKLSIDTTFEEFKKRNKLKKSNLIFKCF